MSEEKKPQEQEPKSFASKPARTDETKAPPATGFLHGMSEQSHRKFLAFEKRFEKDQDRKS